MDEGLPVWVWLPLFVITTAALVYQRRSEWAVWLGFKEKK